jgi:hypothetical protein
MDANGNVLTFQHDALKQMTYRYQGITTLAKFNYDEGVAGNAVGRRMSTCSDVRPGSTNAQAGAMTLA